jgi:hypothetical protein
MGSPPCSWLPEKTTQSNPSIPTQPSSAPRSPPAGSSLRRGGAKLYSSPRSFHSSPSHPSPDLPTRLWISPIVEHHAVRLPPCRTLASPPTPRSRLSPRHIRSWHSSPRNRLPFCLHPIRSLWLLGFEVWGCFHPAIVKLPLTFTNFGCPFRFDPGHEPMSCTILVPLFCPWHDFLPVGHILILLGFMLNSCWECMGNKCLYVSLH